MEYIVGCLISRKAVDDMQKVNTFLTTPACSHILDLAALSIGYATRLGQLNRVLSDTRKLLDLVKEMHDEVNATSDDVVMRVGQKLDSLLSNLTAPRHYVRHLDTGEYVYDPRYLVFGKCRVWKHWSHGLPSAPSFV